MLVLSHCHHWQHSLDLIAVQGSGSNLLGDFDTVEVLTCAHARKWHNRFATIFPGPFLCDNISDIICPSFGINKAITKRYRSDVDTILSCSSSHEVWCTTVHVKPSIKNKGHNPWCNNILVIVSYVLNKKRVFTVHDTASILYLHKKLMDGCWTLPIAAFGKWTMQWTRNAVNTRLPHTNK